jgi:L-threonylcarbamoyladenylate synthase
VIQKTLLLTPASQDDLALALSLLKKGELVAVPTETVYGLAADAKNPEAVRKIFAAKNRPATHPLIVHIASPTALGEWAEHIPSVAWTLAQHFWPGPLTLLLNKAPGVNTIVTGGLSTIAVRVPQHATLLALLKQLDTGLAAPSANVHKKISPTTAAHVMAGLSGKIAAVIDAGPCAIGLESTIVDVTGDIPTILRPGPITASMIEAVLQRPVQAHRTHTHHVAGNMAVHYQPQTPALLLSLEAITAYLALPENQDKTFALMHYSPWTGIAPLIKLHKMPCEKAAYAKVLYNTLHTLDQQNVAQILIEKPPQSCEWSDVWDRLSKATHR